MNKQDIKSGMGFTLRNGDKYYIVERACYIREKGLTLKFVGSAINILGHYNDDFTSKEFKTKDIMIIKDSEGNPIWVRNEIWNPAPAGTQVRVRNSKQDEWVERIFVCCVPAPFRFKTLSKDLSEFEYWTECVYK